MKFLDLQKAALYPLVWLPTRFVLAFLGFFGFINMYMTRVNLSIILVEMVRSVPREHYCGYGDATQDQLCADNNTSRTIATGELPWDPATTGLVLGMFFYGYALTQVVGGRLAEIVGTKRVFGGAILASGVLTLFTPAAARLHVGALCALRVLEGVAQGVTWPSMHAIMVRWVPRHQRPRFVATVYLAATLGVVVTMPLCGLIMDRLGWAAAFYITGASSIVWSAVWWIFIFDTPEEHPRIKQEELEYILEHVRSTGTSGTRMRRAPWKSIFRSVPFMALFIADCGNSFSFTIFVTQLPLFLASQFSFSILQNSWLSAAPFLTRYVGAVLFSCLADYFVASGKLSVGTVRKAFAAIAMLGAAALMLVVVFVDMSTSGVVAIMCVTMFFNGAIASSVIVNHTDIAPNYAATLFGLTNTAGSVASGIAPFLTGLIVSDGTMQEWRAVFGMCVAFYALPGLIFIAFSSGSVQPWNYEAESLQEGRDKDKPEASDYSAVEQRQETDKDTILIDSHAQKMEVLQ